MNSELLVFGFIQYIVFLFSTTCHEAAHALAAKLGGDMTAFEGGQVSLSPLPHIRREPFGMVVMPLLGIMTQTGLIGWASAPYNPFWSQRYPKRAALMSLAGPAANFTLAFIAGVLLRTMHGVTRGGAEEGIGVVLTTFFTLNILLGCFNLIPIPPLDGFGALGLLVSEDGAAKLEQFRMRSRSFAFIGLLLAWRLLDYIYTPVLNLGIRLVRG